MIRSNTKIIKSKNEAKKEVIELLDDNIEISDIIPIKKEKGNNAPVQNIVGVESKEICNEQLTNLIIAYGNYTITKRVGDAFGPYSSQWHHHKQVHDIIDAVAQKRLKQFLFLKSIILPVQGSDAWHEMRKGKITASDAGTTLGLNTHEDQYTVIMKKTVGSEFKSNKFCYHGKKFEKIATMIYETRMNVQTDEFGLLSHPKYDFLGASPDGICGPYKLDNTHKSKLVGRMLEIKCPLTREIQMEGDIIDGICPIYYWAQVQLQLECCDLDECDFWQCKISEYDDRQEFIDDTSETEPFRSKETGFEKGCLIQLLPKKVDTTIKYADFVYNTASHIYPPKVEMSPVECDIWISETLSKITSDPEYKNVHLDRIVWWKLEQSKNVIILRDQKWFDDNLENLRKMWDYILFFRANQDKLDVLQMFVKSVAGTRNQNEKIMKVVADLYDVNNKNYDQILAKIISDALEKMDKTEKAKAAKFLKPAPVKIVKKIIKFSDKKKNNDGNNDGNNDDDVTNSDYAFSD